MQKKESQVHLDPRSLNPSALAGIDHQEARIAITAALIGDLQTHGVTTWAFRRRHPLDASRVGIEVWARVRSLPCVGGRNVEQEFAKWPSSGSPSIALGELTRVLLAAVARREALRRELVALEALGTVTQHEAPDPTISLKKALSQVEVEPWMRGQQEAS